MVDYFLLDYEIVETAKKKGGRITLTGRGSSAGFLVNTLLGFSKIDRLESPVKMYPERFMSETRILKTRSLPDLDLNTGNPDVFLQAQDEVLGEKSSYLMICYGTYKVKSAFKLYAKSQNIPFAIANAISQQIEAYENDYKHADDDIKDTINVYNYVDKEYHDIIRDSEKYQSIISDKKPAPCASLIYQGNIKEEIGLIKIKGKNGKKDVLVAAIDGNVAEDYKFLKNDLLKVDVVNIIYDTFSNIGQEPFSVNELIEITKNDKKVWDIYSKGLTVCLNQVEKESTKQKIMRYKPQNISELTAFIAAIRPSFQSMYSIFEKRQKFVYGIKVFDELLQDEYMKSSFLLYQEQIMATLNYAGIDQSETYGIIKAIAKKKTDQVLKWKDIFIQGFKEKILETENITVEEALKKTMQVWQIINDASSYGFNASHAYAVACDSLYCAYLKANYPLIFFETVLNYYANKNDKDKISEIKKELEAFKIKINPIKFRHDNRSFKSKNNFEINESMVSVKYLNKQISKELYKLRNDIHFDFIDLLEDIKIKTGIQTNQLEVLIKLNYFEEFGLTQELLDYTKIFETYWNKTNKCYRKQITKKIAVKNELNISILERFASITPKSYTKLQTKQIIRENCRLVERKSMNLIDQLKAELEYLGYIRYKTDNADRHKVFILDVQNADKNINPRVDIYSLGTGKVATLKIRKYLFGFKKFDIIHITKLEAKPKYLYLGIDENGKQKFKKSTTEKEW